MSDLASLKNIVIVGMGPAGIAAARALAPLLPPTHRIVGLNATDYVYYPVAGMRGAVEPGFENDIILPLDTIFSASSRHVVVTGAKVISMSTAEVTLQEAVPHFGTVVPFDYLVLASGTSAPFPSRPPSAFTTVTAARESFQLSQAGVAEATSILIVGAGPTGIEFAGEVAGHHGVGAKRITLVGRGDRLPGAGWKDSLGLKLERQLKDVGVDVVLNTGVDIQGLQTGPVPGGLREFALSSGEKVSADYLVLAYGSVTNTSFVADFDRQAVTSRGQVRVKPTLQLIDNDHIFAIGDATDVAEEKMMAWAVRHGPVVAANIVALIAGRPAATKYTPGMHVMGVNIGKTGGAMQLPGGIVVGSWFVVMIKGKTLRVPQFKELLTTLPDPVAATHKSGKACLAAPLGVVALAAAFLLQRQ